MSIKNYIDKHNPKIAVRASAKEYLKNGSITNIPLYFVGKIFELACDAAGAADAASGLQFTPDRNQ